MLTIDDRPKTLNELAGLDKIAKEVAGYFQVGKPCTFPQVSIFEGHSGTGKTSLAYLLAPMLSAPSSILRLENDPLGYPFPNQDHAATKQVFSERFARDVIFKDASSMNKDDIHDIEDSLSTQPMYDQAKVVIIDEAQELTKGGKGAILKLLEKKRDKVYLILCTMNIDAFDKAVRSRAQVFSFKKPTRKILAEHLFNLLENHNLTVPDIFIDEGLFTIADASDGSVRQAVQYLEKCVSAELWSEEQIVDSLGVVASAKTMAEILGRLLECDASVIAEVAKVDPKEFLFRLSFMLTDAVVWQMTGDCKQDWMEKQYIRYQESGRVPALLQIVNKLCGLPYLRDSIVVSELALYMMEAKRPALRPVARSEQKEEPKPVFTRTSKPVQKVLEDHPLVGYCADCGEPQYQSPSGNTCKNGHGGAETLTKAELDAILNHVEAPISEEPKRATRRVI